MLKFIKSLFIPDFKRWELEAECKAFDHANKLAAECYNKESR